MSIINAIVNAIPGTAPAAAAAVDAAGGAEALASEDHQRPTDADLASDSADVAAGRLLTRGYARPITEPAAPYVDEQVPEWTPAGPRGIPTAPPIPSATAIYGRTGDAVAFAVPVRVVDGAGGRPRRVVIRATTDVTLYSEAMTGADTTTPALGGFVLPQGAELVTYTQGTVWAAHSAAWSVSVLIDTYGEPTSRVAGSQ